MIIFSCLDPGLVSFCAEATKHPANKERDMIRYIYMFFIFIG